MRKREAWKKPNRTRERVFGLVSESVRERELEWNMVEGNLAHKTILLFA
jgi:hypothetical protein